MSAESTHSTSVRIDHHPDLVAKNARYEELASRPVAQVTDALLLLAGFFVALAPWIVGYYGAAPALARISLVIGLAVALLAAAFAVGYERTHRLAWLVPLLGAWTIVAPWVIDGTSVPTEIVLTNVIGGACVLAIGLAAAFPTVMGRRS